MSVSERKNARPRAVLTIAPSGTGSASLAAHGPLGLKLAIAFTPTHGRVRVTDVSGVTVP
jgi:hypothetical protein